MDQEKFNEPRRHGGAEKKGRKEENDRERTRKNAKKKIVADAMARKEKPLAGVSLAYAAGYDFFNPDSSAILWISSHSFQ